MNNAASKRQTAWLIKSTDIKTLLNLSVNDFLGQGTQGATACESAAVAGSVAVAVSSARSSQEANLLAAVAAIGGMAAGGVGTGHGPDRARCCTVEASSGNSRSSHNDPAVADAATSASAHAAAACGTAAGGVGTGHGARCSAVDMSSCCGRRGHNFSAAKAAATAAAADAAAAGGTTDGVGMGLTAAVEMTSRRAFRKARALGAY
jgi:hypothetical protein